MTTMLGPFALGPSGRTQGIYTGDCMDLGAHVPDGSIDAIFTDPEYPRRELYAWLGEWARRVLKPTGAVLVWANGKWHRRNANWLEAAGLTYRWDFACVRTSGSSPLNGHIITKTNRLLWLDMAEQSAMRGYLADGWLSTIWSQPGMHNHRWTKNPRFTMQAIQAFTEPGAVVADPFSGGATIPACCALLGRRYLAFEIDPATAEDGRERVRQQPPLFVPEEQQLALEVGV